MKTQFFRPGVLVVLALVGMAATAVWAQGVPPPFTGDIVRVVGPTYGSVVVSGTVTSNPSQSFLDALSPTCAYPEGPPVVTTSTTAATMDDATITDRSQMTIVSLAPSGGNDIWCCKGTSCTPTATAAYILRPGTAYLFEGLRDSDTIRCRSEAGTPKLNVIEVSCAQ